MRIRRSCVLVLLAWAPLGAWAETGAASPPRIHFGIETNQVNVNWTDLLATWRQAEALGFDNAWVFDHFMPLRKDHDRSCLESWTLLAALAAETHRIRLGTLVSGNTYRNPALLAKMATTVDRISNGRLNLGIGAGWFAPDHVAYGFAFYTPKERTERLAEALAVISRLWSTAHPSFTGRYYRLSHAPFAPPPVQRPHPPIIVGGRGKKWIMPLVARYADGWTVPLGVSPQGVKNRLDIIHAECRRIGRTPCNIEVSVAMWLVAVTAPGATPAPAGAAAAGKRRWQLLDGPPAQIQAQIRRYLDVGATDIILLLPAPFDHDMLRAFATQVMPAFQQPVPSGALDDGRR